MPCVDGNLQKSKEKSVVVLSRLFRCSPHEAYQAFQAHRVSETQFAEQGAELISRTSLMCRLGDRLFPWSQAAPVVMGALAFGGDWQHLLPADGGPVAVPPPEAPASRTDARKVRHRAPVPLHLAHSLLSA